MRRGRYWRTGEAAEWSMGVQLTLQRVSYAIILCVMAAVGAAAQTTTVTGTITDPNGNPYAGGTASAIASVAAGLNPGPPLIVTTNASGVFSFAGATALPSPQSYTFTICAPPVQLGPRANPTPPQVCFSNTTPIAVFGGLQDVSGTLNAVAAVLGPVGSNGAGSNPLGASLNVRAFPYNASPNLVDNATAFAAAAAAANTASYVQGPSPSIRSSTKTVMSSGAVASANATVNITAGDTILVGTIALNGPGVLTYSVSDGVNTYYPVNLNSSPVGTFNEQIQVFGTPPGGAKACSSCTLTVTITAGGPAQFGFFVLDAFNVGSYGQTNLFNSSTSSATPTVTVTTQDTNNIVASWIDYCNAGGVTISANTGTLQQSWNSTAVICGAGLVTNTAASSLTSLTTSASLSAGSVWAINGIELRSVTTVSPTIYFPAGRYSYSSGLNFTNAVTLKGEPGTVLCYTGTAHAVDLGPSGLTFATLQPDPYKVDGIRFECGAGMTQGLFFQNNVLYGVVTNNVFYNFGSTTSNAIFSNGDTEDMNITSNRFMIFDGAPGLAIVPSRSFVNVTTNSPVSTTTLINNFMFCGAAKLGAMVGCGTTSGPAVTLQSYANIVSNNSWSGGFCPSLALIGGGTSAIATKIQNNNFETDQNNCYAITFNSALDSLRVLNNFWNNKCNSPTTCSLVGPSGGTQLLTNAEVSSNVITNNPANNPVVAQNNLAAQTNNTGWHNTCSTAQYSGTTPCPLLHTAGGSINQWNNDYAGSCTMASGACTAYSYLTTYAVAPKCTASWTGSGTLTGLLKAASTTAALTITSTVGTDTAVVNWACNPDAQ
jgi:hypothetical protein